MWCVGPEVRECINRVRLMKWLERLEERERERERRIPWSGYIGKIEVTLA